MLILLNKYNNLFISFINYKINKMPKYSQDFKIPEVLNILRISISIIIYLLLMLLIIDQCCVIL